MFAPFFSFLEAKETPNFNFEDFCNSREGSSIKSLFKELKSLPFFSTAYAKIVQNSAISIDTDFDFYSAFVSIVLDEKGLAYPNLLKALIPFFVDEQGVQWTAFEAQLLESLQLRDTNPATPIHLTIDTEYKRLFETAEDHFRTKLNLEQTTESNAEYS